MLRSMTGYGRGEIKEGPFPGYFVEIHSVNRKYADININMPGYLIALESRIRKIVSENAARGRINVRVGHRGGGERSRLSLNKQLIREYYTALKMVKREMKIKGDITIDIISGLKDIVQIDDPKVEPLKLWPQLEKTLRDALNRFNRMREKEGAVIAVHIEKPIKNIETYLGKIKRLAPKLTSCFEKRLRKRIRDTGLSLKESDERIQKEVAVLADHIDITEEINRMDGHISNFRDVMKKRSSAGKTMDFLIQEMMREINTMGSKSQDMRMSGYTVYIKGELEKIREQIQNIE